MARRSIAAIALPMLLTLFMAAQTSQTSAQAKSSPKIRISFPSGISLDNVWLEYGLFGPSGGRVYIGLPGSSAVSGIIPPFDAVGGQGHVVEPKGYPDHYYEVVALEDGNAVDRFKALAWARGCRMVTFDAVVGTEDVVLPFTCTPLKSFALAGHVQRVDFGGQSGSEVSVGYQTFLSCSFLTVCKDGPCFMSCGGMQIPAVATAKINADGTFKIELPNFAVDPFASSDNSAEFEFSLNDVVLAPGQPNYRHMPLEPESKDLRSQIGGLKLAATYPSDLILVPRKY